MAVDAHASAVSFFAIDVQRGRGLGGFIALAVAVPIRLAYQMHILGYHLAQAFAIVQRDAANGAVHVQRAGRVGEGFFKLGDPGFVSRFTRRLGVYFDYARD